MRGQAKFNPEVKRAVFSKRRMTSRCLEHVSATSLVDEDDMASRRSEFHLVNLTGKRAWQEHHLSRKKCRVRMRQYIIGASWTVYEQETWNRLKKKVMVMYPTVEQHEMVLFHDRWVRNQFRDQD